MSFEFPYRFHGFYSATAISDGEGCQNHNAFFDPQFSLASNVQGTLKAVPVAYSTTLACEVAGCTKNLGPAIRLNANMLSALAGYPNHEGCPYYRNHALYYVGLGTLGPFGKSVLDMAEEHVLAQVALLRHPHQQAFISRQDLTLNPKIQNPKSLNPKPYEPQTVTPYTLKNPIHPHIPLYTPHITL